VCFWRPPPDLLNTVLGDMIDNSFVGLVKEWAACDKRLDDPKEEIHGLSLISARLLDPARRGDRNLTRSRLTTNYNRIVVVLRFI
jgi:hypothetical protein